jgi:acyl dehydratase
MMGLFLEEIEIGRRFDLGTHHFTDERIRSFSAQFIPVDFHVDEGAALNGLFGGRVAAGWQICCGWMACFVATNKQERARLAAGGKSLPEIGPSPGLSNLRWPSPVRAGDDIRYGVVFTGKRELKSRPDWGMVSIDAEGRKSDGTTVMTFSGNVMVACVKR